MTTRCEWRQDNGTSQKYHDEEWGIPVHDDRRHFEFLMMEVAQCGSSQAIMLDKRRIFHQCLDNFDCEEIIHYDEKKIQEIMETPGMIRSPRKIRVTIIDARAYLEVIQECGSFDKFLQSYTDGKTLAYKGHRQCPIASNDVSDAVSEKLKKRDFRYLGSITVYSHLQAHGMTNDREEPCFLYRQLCDGSSVEYRG